MKTVEMAGVLAEVGGAINHYGIWVSKKCGMDIDDARQEMLIAAWKSAAHYHQRTAGCERKKWIMSELYFKSRKIVDLRNKRMRVEQKTYPKLFPLIQTVTEDPAVVVINRIEREQEIAALHQPLQQIARLASMGMNQQEIAREMGYSAQWINRIVLGK